MRANAMLIASSIIFALLGACRACQRALRSERCYRFIGAFSIAAILLSIAAAITIDGRLILTIVIPVAAWMILAGLASIRRESASSHRVPQSTRTHA